MDTGPGPLVVGWRGGWAYDDTHRRSHHADAMDAASRNIHTPTIGQQRRSSPGRLGHRIRLEVTGVDGNWAIALHRLHPTGPGRRPTAPSPGPARVIPGSRKEFPLRLSQICLASDFVTHFPVLMALLNQYCSRSL